MSDGEGPQPRLGRRATVLSASVTYLAFAVPTSMLGVVWPDVRVRFDQSLGALGVVALVYGIGRLSTATSGRPIVRRIGMGRAFISALLLLAIACACLATAGSWTVFLVSVGALGAICGSLDSIGASFIAGRAHVGDAGLIHGSYGLGATIGPIVVATVPNWRLAIATGVIAAGCAVVAAASARDSWPASAGSARTVFDTPGRVPKVAVIASVLTLGTFVAIEVTTGQWAHTYLTEGRGISDRVAAVGVAGFWGGSTLGRITMAHPAVVRLTRRVGMPGIAIGGAAMLVGMVVGPDASALVLLMLSGIVLSPIVPSLFATTATRVGSQFAASVAGWQLIATNIGAISVPALVGQLVDSQGPDIILTVTIVVLVAGGLPLLVMVGRLPNRLADPVATHR